MMDGHTPAPPRTLGKVDCVGPSTGGSGMTLATPSSGWASSGAHEVSVEEVRAASSVRRYSIQVPLSTSRLAVAFQLAPPSSARRGGLLEEGQGLVMAMAERQNRLAQALGDCRAENRELRAYSKRLAAALAESIRGHQGLEAAFAAEEAQKQEEENPLIAAAAAELEEVASAVSGAVGAWGAARDCS
jgi:hypothetical protein